MILRLTGVFLTVLVMAANPEPCSEYGCPHPPRHEPFLPALPGHTPRCAKPGQTFCERLDHYPQQLIRFLIDKWSFDYNTLLIDESRDGFNSYRSKGTGIPQRLQLPTTGSTSAVSTTVTVPPIAIPLQTTRTNLRTSDQQVPAGVQLSDTVQVAEQPVLAAGSRSFASSAFAASSAASSFPSTTRKSVLVLRSPGSRSPWTASRLVARQVHSEQREERSIEKTSSSIAACKSSPGVCRLEEEQISSSGERLEPSDPALPHQFAVHHAQSSAEQPRQLDVRGEPTGTGGQVHPAGEKRDVRIGYLQRLVHATNRIHE
ncbi:uncharacterized protein LOC124303560 isoform X2 [Neodiprion virginianus]|uniref:uncharacterized protein LOC124303560 isoform X2 n=1 Tax=Neodiprion virginianus TaxID=2961670 RepID=UPI001EE6FC8D|nr:uncharacterized protein LOC124303560 isoform X2 [Neodiprion virginianus]